MDNLFNNLDYFPLWKPQKITEAKFKSFDYKTRITALRNSSSAFIKRKDVRNIVFRKDRFKCVYCNSKINLTIDHIMSVRKVAIGQYPLEKLNIRENLQTLCFSCNSKKKP